MHFEYEKFFLGQNQSPNHRPSTDAIMSGLRPRTLSGHGPGESYPLKISKIFLSPKLLLLSIWGSWWPTGHYLIVGSNTAAATLDLRMTYGMIW